MTTTEITRVLAGGGTKRQQGALLAVVLAVFGFGTLYAQAVFPGRYSILENHVSDQGGIHDNPRGFLVFDTCVVATGILLVPFFLWLARRLLPTTPPLSYLAVTSGIIGSLGFSMVGAFPEDLGTIHEVAAGLAFGGLGASAFFCFLIMARKMWLRDQWPKPWQFALLYGQIVAVGVLAVLFQTKTVVGVDPRLYSWPPWQWSLMLSLLAWLTGTFA
ncbi:MAG: DUF998 domain-containing protein, partial [Promethearchaeota archaeon]